MVVVSAGHVGGTCGSGIVSSIADVLWMGVMRGVGPPILLHIPIYLKQHTGPLDVSRESGASADQLEETPGRAYLEKLGCRTPPQLHAGGPLHSYTQEG